MGKGGIILTWRKHLLADLLLDDLQFDVETLIFQLGSHVELSGGEYTTS